MFRRKICNAIALLSLSESAAIPFSMVRSRREIDVQGGTVEVDTSQINRRNANKNEENAPTTPHPFSVDAIVGVDGYIVTSTDTPDLAHDFGHDFGHSLASLNTTHEPIEPHAVQQPSLRSADGIESSGAYSGSDGEERPRMFEKTADSEAEIEKGNEDIGQQPQQSERQLSSLLLTSQNSLELSGSFDDVFLEISGGAEAITTDQALDYFKSQEFPDKPVAENANNLLFTMCGKEFKTVAGGRKGFDALKKDEWDHGFSQLQTVVAQGKREFHKREFQDFDEVLFHMRYFGEECALVKDKQHGMMCKIDVLGFFNILTKYGMSNIGGEILDRSFVTSNQYSGVSAHQVFRYIVQIYTDTWKAATPSKEFSESDFWGVFQTKKVLSFGTFLVAVKWYIDDLAQLTALKTESGADPADGSVGDPQKVLKYLNQFILITKMNDGKPGEGRIAIREDLKGTIGQKMLGGQHGSFTAMLDKIESIPLDEQALIGASTSGTIGLNEFIKVMFTFESQGS